MTSLAMLFCLFSKNTVMQLNLGDTDKNLIQSKYINKTETKQKQRPTMHGTWVKFDDLLQ